MLTEIVFFVFDFICKSIIYMNCFDLEMHLTNEPEF